MGGQDGRDTILAMEKCPTAVRHASIHKHTKIIHISLNCLGLQEMHVIGTPALRKRERENSSVQRQIFSSLFLPPDLRPGFQEQIREHNCGLVTLSKNPYV